MAVFSNMTSATGQAELHFAVSAPADRARAEREHHEGSMPEMLRIPRGVWALRPEGEIVPCEESESCCATLVVEPLVADGRPRLLLLALRADAVPVVNGRRAPRVRLLEVGDQLLLRSGLLLRVVAYHPSRIGVPSAEQVGRSCVMCRTPISADSRVYACPMGCLLHFGQGDDAADTETLECAKLATECPACRQPIVLQEGFERGDDDD